LDLIRGERNGVAVDPRELVADRDRRKLKYFIEGNPVSATEFWECQAARQMDIPLLPDAPIPKTTKELKNQIQQLVGRVEHRNQQIDATTRNRDRRFRTWWIPVLGALAFLLLSLLFLIPLALETLNTLEELKEQLAIIALSTWQFLRLILMIFFAILFVHLLFVHFRSHRRTTLREVLMTFLLSEVLAVLIFPLVFGIHMTYIDIFRSLVFDFLAEATVYLVGFSSSTRDLESIKESSKAIKQEARELLAEPDKLSAAQRKLDTNRGRMPADPLRNRKQGALQRFISWLY
jgi:hypothetical protein